MAKIQEDFIVLKISRIAKESDILEGVLSNELATTITGLVEQLIKEEGTDCIVELEDGEEAESS